MSKEINYVFEEDAALPSSCEEMDTETFAAIMFKLGMVQARLDQMLEDLNAVLDKHLAEKGEEE